MEERRMTETPKKSGHGGARPGAGRKPKWGVRAKQIEISLPPEVVAFFQARATDKSHSLSAELAERLIRSYRASKGRKP